jgi:hypothetical protein
VEIIDKEISEIKINPVPKTQNICVKILKQLFASGSVIIIKYHKSRKSRVFSRSNIDFSTYYLPLSRWDHQMLLRVIFVLHFIHFKEVS